MSFAQILDKIIKPELENVFGSAMTARILMTARAKAFAPIVNMQCADCERIIEAVCTDERVCGMWGAAGSEERKNRWKTALRKEVGSGS